MVEIKFLARVDKKKCMGCNACENVCPTEAIKVVNKKAKVYPKKCLACPNCSGICPEDAITMVPRGGPLKLPSVFLQQRHHVLGRETQMHGLGQCRVHHLGEPFLADFLR